MFKLLDKFRTSGGSEEVKVGTRGPEGRKVTLVLPVPLVPKDRKARAVVTVRTAYWVGRRDGKDGVDGEDGEDGRGIREISQAADGTWCSR